MPRHPRFVWPAGTLLLGVVACDRPPATGLEIADLAVNLSAPQPHRPIRTLDDDFADLVGEVPGFGGLFYDETGALTVYLKDPTTLPAVRSALEAFLVRGAEHIPGVVGDLAAQVAGMQARAAQYDFRELYDWYLQAVVPLVGGFEGVTMTDINDRLNRIVVGVKDIALAPAVETQLAGQLPREVVQVEEFPAIRIAAVGMQQDCDPAAIRECDTGGGGGGTSASLREEDRPVVGGVQIPRRDFFGNVFTCTLGYNMLHWFAGGSQDAERYFVTNSHCTDVFGVDNGNAMGQPTFDVTVGAEVSDPPLFDSSQDSRCPPSRECRYSDAALLRYDASSLAQHGYVAFPPVESVIFSENRGVAWRARPGGSLMGLDIDKIGRTTGRTRGPLFNICVNFAQADDQGIDTGRTMLCQGHAFFDGAQGDSGSPVVYLRSDGFLVDLGIFWGADPDAGAAFSMSDLYHQELQADFGGTLSSVMQ